MEDPEGMVYECIVTPSQISTAPALKRRYDPTVNTIDNTADLPNAALMSKPSAKSPSLGHENIMKPCLTVIPWRHM